ncbi:MAG: hypothetical protein V4721_02015 [Bacteroidota bacterium]
MTKCLALVTLFCSVTAIAFCQSGKGSNEGPALEYARELYHKSLSDQAGIYSGPEYIGYPHPAKTGNQFFNSIDVSRGDIYYDGMQYKNVPLQYDLARNEVIVKHLDNFSQISLHNEKIRDFTVFDHHFIKMDEEASAKSGLPKGFYDQLYSGKSEVLVRRTKEFIITTDQQGIWMSFFDENKNIYLRKGTEYTPVSSRKSVLKALGKNEKEIQAHLKQSGIKFKNAREKAIVAMVAYYDKLNN